MKRGLRVVVSLLLGACGMGASSEHEAAAREVVVWHSYRGAERTVLESLAERFEAGRPGTQVRLLPVPYDALPDKLTAAVPRGNGPDVFIFAHDRLGDWADTDLAEPLGLRVTEKLADTFARATLDALSHRGELWGLPLAFKTLALYRNSRLAPDAPETTDALIERAQTARSRDPAVWGIAWELDSLYFHAPWLHGFGGTVYVAGTDRPAFDGPAAVRSVDFVRRLVADTKLVPPEPTSALMTTLFREGHLAYVVSGPWFRGELADQRDWAVSTLPIVSETGRRAAPFLGVEAVVVSRRARDKDTAFALAAYLASDEAAARRYGEGGQLVANLAVHESAAFREDPFARAFAAQVEASVPLSNRPHMRRVWTPVKDALNAAVFRGADAATALGRAAREVVP